LSAAYLIDADGMAIASSNWNRSYSFIAHDYQFRPYFKVALAGGDGSLYAVGTTTGEPGYYLSSPVMDGGRVVGVMVVKVRLDLPLPSQSDTTPGRPSASFRRQRLRPRRSWHVSWAFFPEPEPCLCADVRNDAREDRRCRGR
jgi:hypothetical protein